jgi:GNAT superfamily N-acetyltransferase
MVLRLRPGQPDDALAVAAVHEAAARVAYAHIFPADQPFPTEPTRRRWRTFAGHLVVAEEEGRLVGFVAFDAAELHALYVLPAYWGWGLGSRLLRAAGPVGRLWVLRDNARARRFYEGHGWRADGTERVAGGVVEVRYRRAADEREGGGGPGRAVVSGEAAGAAR